MKNLSIRILLICFASFYICTEITEAQTDTVISRLFYNINPDSSRESLYKKIRSDKRFLAIDTPAYYDINEYTYYGKVSDPGFIRIHADSIRIELTLGYGGGFYYNRHHKLKPNKKLAYDETILRLHYFFSVKDSIEKVYNQLVSYLYSTNKKVSCPGMVTTEDPNKTGECCFMYFNEDKKIPFLEITLWSLPRKNLPNQCFSLELEYERKGK